MWSLTIWSSSTVKNFWDFEMFEPAEGYAMTIFWASAKGMATIKKKIELRNCIVRKCLWVMRLKLGLNTNMRSPLYPTTKKGCSDGWRRWGKPLSATHDDICSYRVLSCPSFLRQSSRISSFPIRKGLVMMIWRVDKTKDKRQYGGCLSIRSPRKNLCYR